MASRVLTGCAGFLFAVLWFDLMFDVQVLRARSAPILPEPILASIRQYYRRVTTDASPMGLLVGTTMIVAIVAALVQAWMTDRAGWLRFLPVVLVGAPAVLALGRVVPDAVRLGGGADPPEVQSELARRILFDHLACLASIAALLAVQIGALA